jgi:hypothetical protein
MFYNFAKLHQKSLENKRFQGFLVFYTEGVQNGDVKDNFKFKISNFKMQQFDYQLFAT